jgi:hypothetical protein
MLFLIYFFACLLKKKKKLMHVITLSYVRSQCLSGINFAHVLEPSCAFASPKPQATFDQRRSLYQNPKVFLDPDPSLPPFGCRVSTLHS